MPASARVLNYDEFWPAKGIDSLANVDQAILDVIPVAICVSGVDGKIIRHNRRADELWEGAAGAFDFQDVCGRRLTHDEHPLALVVASGSASYGMEFFITRPDGDRRAVLVDAEPLRKSGRVTGAIGCIRDITERNKIEEDLRRRREDLRRQREDLEDFFENGAVGLHLVGSDGTILRANQAELDLLGYSAEEYVGHAIGEFHVDVDTIADILRRLSAGERLDRYPARLRAKDGSIKHVQITSNVNFRDGEFANTRCFTVDVTDRHRALTALHESEQRARDILDALAAVYTTDAAGRLTFFNEASVAFSGRRPELGTDEWCVSWRLYETDGTPLPHDQCPMAIALREGREVRGVEAIAERPDGSRVRFMPFPTPLRDSTGKVVGAVNMLVDIGERHRAEAQQQLLIDELNHRVRNTLAIVQSIASQTLRSTPEPDAFVSNLQGRLVALGKAHDLLTRRRWTGVGLGELFDQELAPFLDADTDRLVLDGPEITLSPRIALALGLVIHELAANAAKFGALSNESGSVRLSWAVTAQAGCSKLSMAWLERGGPIVAQPTRRGFGSGIIARSIERDLAGTVQLAFPPEGMRSEMEFPLD